MRSSARTACGIGAAAVPSPRRVPLEVAERVLAVRKDCAALRVRVSGRMARDAEGINHGYLVVMENRNEQRAIEAQLSSERYT
jgi:hypothetical protein